MGAVEIIQEIKDDLGLKRNSIVRDEAYKSLRSIPSVSSEVQGQLKQ